MLTNHLKIAWRHLNRQKGYAAINIFGLAVGLACCLLIGLHVLDEWSYDRFHDESDRIVQVLRVSEENLHASTPIPLAEVLEEEFAAVDRTVQVTRGPALLRRADEAYRADVTFASAAFFEVFSFDLLAGRPEAVLAAPGQAVLSRTAARRYFGTEDVLGETFDIELQGETFTYQVTGLADDPPAASTLEVDIILSQLDTPGAARWNAARPTLFARLTDADARSALARQLPAFVEMLQAQGLPEGWSLELLPLAERRTTPDVTGQASVATHPAYPYLLLGLATLLLLIASVNFTTMAIGQAAPRAKEVSTRKALGARRYQLAGQFLIETLLLITAALILGLLLARVSLPVFNGLVGKALSLEAAFSPAGLLLLIALLGLVSLLAGAYPAFYLSRFAPSEAMRQQPRLRGKHRLKQGLVVAQFAAAIFLIASTLFMVRQLDLLQERDLGFEPEGLVQISAQQPGLPAPEQVLGTLRNTLSGRTEISGVTGSSMDYTRDPAYLGRLPFQSGEQETEAQTMRLEPGGIDALEMNVVDGRAFADDHVQEDFVLVNESFLEAMGWDDALGRTLSGGPLSEVAVIGVVSDFHVQTLHHPVAPAVIHQQSFEGITHLYARLTPGRETEGLAALEEAWSEAAPGIPFEYAFMDDVIEAQYEDEQQWSRIVSTSALLALVIAGLGLFGLASLTAAQRRREIAIRKVLGATASSVVALLSKDFLKLVAVAFVLAAPLAYYAMQRWLEDFAYRIDIGPGVFLLAGSIALFIALLTVSTQALRAAWTNPAEAIRNE